MNKNWEANFPGFNPEYTGKENYGTLLSYLRAINAPDWVVKAVQVERDKIASPNPKKEPVKEFFRLARKLLKEHVESGPPANRPTPPTLTREEEIERAKAAKIVVDEEKELEKVKKVLVEKETKKQETERKKKEAEALRQETERKKREEEEIKRGIAEKKEKAEEVERKLRELPDKAELVEDIVNLDRIHGAEIVAVIEVLEEKGIPITGKQKEQFEAKKKELEDIQEDRERLRKQVMQLTEAAERCRDAQAGEKREIYEKANADLAEAQQKIKSLEAQVTAKDTREDKMAASLREMKNTSEALQKKVSVEEEKNRSLSEAFQREKDDREEEKKKTSKYALDVVREMKAAKKELADYKEATKSGSSLEESLQQSLEEAKRTAREQQVTLDNAKSTSEATLARLTSEMNALRDDLATSRKEYTTLQESIDKGGSKESIHALAIKDRESTIASLEERIEAMAQQAKNDANHTRNVELQRAFANAELDALKKAQSEKEGSKRTIEEDVHNTQIADLQNRVDELTVEIGTLNENLRKSSEKHDLHMRTIQDLQDRIDLLGQEAGRNENDIKLLADERRRATQALAEKTADLKSASDLLDEETRKRREAVQALSVARDTAMSQMAEKSTELATAVRELKDARQNYSLEKAKYEELQRQIREGSVARQIDPAQSSEDIVEILTKTLSVKEELNTQELDDLKQRVNELTRDLDTIGRIPFYTVTKNYAIEPLGGGTTLSGLALISTFTPSNFVVLSTDSLDRLETYIQECQAKANMTFVPTKTGGPLTFGEGVTKMMYEGLATQTANGTNTLRLLFTGDDTRKVLGMSVGNLYPQVANEHAPAELVADIGRSGKYVNYDYVSALDSDLIPSKGTLTVVRYDRDRKKYEKHYLYEMPRPASDFPYGTESAFTFKDGTRLYASYVTASFYKVDMIVTPYLV